jgi:hypothetical protein
MIDYFVVVGVVAYVVLGIGFHNIIRKQEADPYTFVNVLCWPLALVISATVNGL